MPRTSHVLRLWPGLIFVFFGMNFAVVGVTAWFAFSDPSFAIEPSYDVKAARWQEHAEAAAAGEALGWSIEISPPTLGAPLRVTLLDGSGAPLQGARVEALRFHHAVASERLEELLAERGVGVHEGAAPFERTGRWRVRLSMVRGAQRLLRDIDLTVVPAAADRRPASGQAALPPTS